MANITLHGIEPSPPCRATLLTLYALQLVFDFKMVNLQTGEHLTEEFRKHNPQHTVPVLEDNGVWIWDSHAINAYLVEKYGTSDMLYPKDLVKRARVDQRLHFDSGILFPALRNVILALFAEDLTVVAKDKSARIIEGYDFLETFLSDPQNTYLVGSDMTIADFSALATVTSMRGVIPIDEQKYPKLTAWIKRLSELPYYEKANGKGAAMIVEHVKSKLKKVEM